jgi:hypothetical protein
MHFVNNKIIGKLMLLPGVILISGLRILDQGKAFSNPSELDWDLASAQKLKIENPSIFCEVNNSPYLNFIKAGI